MAIFAQVGARLEKGHFVEIPMFLNSAHKLRYWFPRFVRESTNACVSQQTLVWSTSANMAVFLIYVCDLSNGVSSLIYCMCQLSPLRLLHRSLFLHASLLLLFPPVNPHREAWREYRPASFSPSSSRKHHTSLPLFSLHSPPPSFAHAQNPLSLPFIDAKAVGQA